LEGVQHRATRIIIIIIIIIIIVTFIQTRHNSQRRAVPV